MILIYEPCQISSDTLPIIFVWATAPSFPLPIVCLGGGGVGNDDLQ